MGDFFQVIETLERDLSVKAAKQSRSDFLKGLVPALTKDRAWLNDLSSFAGSLGDLAGSYTSTKFDPAAQMARMQSVAALSSGIDLAAASAAAQEKAAAAADAAKGAAGSLMSKGMGMFGKK